MHATAWQIPICFKHWSNYIFKQLYPLFYKKTKQKCASRLNKTINYKHLNNFKFLHRFINFKTFLIGYNFETNWRFKMAEKIGTRPWYLESEGDNRSKYIKIYQNQSTSWKCIPTDYCGRLLLAFYNKDYRKGHRKFYAYTFIYLH